MNTTKERVITIAIRLRGEAGVAKEVVSAPTIVEDKDRTVYHLADGTHEVNYLEGKRQVTKHIGNLYVLLTPFMEIQSQKLPFQT